METVYADYILHTLHRFPWEWMDRSFYEKAAVYALIDDKVKRDKKREAAIKKKQNSGRRKASVRRPRRR